MPRLSIRSIASRTGLTIGTGGAGWLGALEITRKPGTAAIAAAVLIAALAANAVKSICTALPEITKARGDRESALIRAATDATAQIIRETSEAQTLIMRTQTRTRLLLAGTESDKAGQIVEMLTQQSASTDLPEGRRLNDEALAKLLAAHRARSLTKKPGNGPVRPASRPGGNVFPMHPDD